jgi:hypothetical protein
MWLAAAAAIQFGAVRRAQAGSEGWAVVYKILTVVGLIAGAIGLWLAMAERPDPRVSPSVIPVAGFGRDVALGATVVVLAGVAGWFEWSVTRWFRFLSILSWCMAIAVVVGLSALFFMLRGVNLH